MARKKEDEKKQPTLNKKPKRAAETAPKKKRAGLSSTGTIRFPIVGIGASAGGLEALEAFFSHMPPGSGMAFVIIQHLSPTHKSVMASLLSKKTQMDVVEVEDGMKVEPNRVYLNPPNKNVTIIRGTLHLMDPVKTKTATINLPVDYFFRSMSEELRDQAICIILSGMATDGTLGIMAVKGEGGMVMVQSPESARHDGMPRSAIATGLVDYILPVEQMPGELIRYVQHPYIDGSTEVPVGEEQFKTFLPKIFAQVRTATGHDFSHYKQTTIRRRVERRMAVHQMQKISEYVKYLQRTPAEVGLLFRDLLIGVTSFFRDPEAFEILKNLVLPALLSRKDADTPIRVWVVGCSTGEEAYSLAMVLQESMDVLKKHFDVQVFASDIDAEAIDFARMGVYPESIAADVSRERLNQFFVKQESSYVVKKQLREMIVFSVHNLIKDPPFSKMDLVSCRNLLIYMDATLQRRLLPLFHYVLSQEGILLLGNSESIGEFTDMFSPVDSRHKIFKHNAIPFEWAAPNCSAFPMYGVTWTEPGEEEEQHPAERDIVHMTERILLEAYAPPAVLVNQKYDVLHFIGDTDLYLKPPTGKASFNVLKMAREGLQYKLSTALRDATRQKKIILLKGLRVKHNKSFRMVDVTVRPLVEKRFPGGYMMIIFHDRAMEKPPARDKGKEDGEETRDATVASLEQELAATKEYLQTTIEELETSNEEFQLVNEKLQSTNEELETSKEELQSTNEELITVNSELHSKVEELCRANNDINNLLASTDIGTIFLDTHLRIKRFTPAITRIFNLIQTDVGRPLTDITSKIPGDSVNAYAQEVLKTLSQKEMEVQTKAGSWYSMRMVPYRTLENVIDGVVITFVDITASKKTEELLKTILQTALDGFFLMDARGRFLEVNDAFCDIIGYSRDELLQMSVNEIEAKESSREIAERIKKVVETGTDRFETLHRCKDGRLLFVEVSVNYLDWEGGRFSVFVRDITERKRLQSEMRLETVLKDSDDAVIVHAPDGKILAWNRGAQRIYGWSEAEALKMNLRDLVPEDKRDEALAIIKKIQKGGSVDSFRARRKTKDGQILDVWVRLTPLPDSSGKPLEIATIERDLAWLAKR